MFEHLKTIYKVRKMTDERLLEKRFMLRQRSSIPELRVSALRTMPGLSDREREELKVIEKECSRPERRSNILLHADSVARKYDIVIPDYEEEQ